MNIQTWFPLGMTDFFSLQSKGLSRGFCSTTIENHQFFSAQPSLWSSHICTWLLEKPSVQFNNLLMSDSLQAHGLQHVRFPYPLPTARPYSNSCPSSWWYHPTISSSVVPFSSHLQSFPESGSFQMSHFFASRGQCLEFQLQHHPCNEYSGLISFRDSQGSSPTPQLKSISSLVISFIYGPILTSIHDYWKNHSFD